MTGFCIFGEEIFFLEIVLKTKYLCIRWACRNVAQWQSIRLQIERSAVQFRSLPSSLLWVYLLKDFTRLNLRLVLIVQFFELRRHMNHDFSWYFVVFYDRLLCFWG